MQKEVEIGNASVTTRRPGMPETFTHQYFGESRIYAHKQRFQRLQYMSIDENE